MNEQEITFQERCRNYWHAASGYCQTSLVDHLLDIGVFFEDEIQNDRDPNIPENWWIVSADFSEYLKERGEIILRNDYGTWWGRQTFGQAVHMDSVIRKIVYQIENRNIGEI